MPQLRRRQGSDSDDEDGDYITHTAIPSGGSTAVRRCKVDGCGVSLTKEKTFFRRARCCQVHARELTVLLDGQAKRICQQCSSFHPVAAFDGSKRSCRERLEVHKIRQRELNSRRMAQATAFQAAQEAARADSTMPAVSSMHAPTLTASMLPAAPPSQQLPTVQAATLLAAQQLQQQCMAQAEVQLSQMPSMTVQPTMPPIPSQHQEALQQRQVWGGFGNAATAADMPGTFADVPPELPFDMQSQHQVEEMMNWEAQHMSTLGDEPPPDFNGNGRRMFKAQSVPLPRSSSKDGLFNGTSGGDASFRNPFTNGYESDDWLSWWADATGAALAPSLSRSPDTATKPAGDTDIRRLLGSGSFCSTQQASVASDRKVRKDPSHWSPFDTAPRVPAKRPARGAGLPPRHFVKSASFESADSRRSRQLLFEDGLLKPTFQGSSMLGRGFDGMQTANSCNIHSLAAASWHASRDSFDSRGSYASLPSIIAPPPASATEEPLPFAARRAMSLPLSPKAPLFAKLPDIDEEAHSRAFHEQAPKPLYRAAQLVMDGGLRHAGLPEFSYGRSRGSDASCAYSSEGNRAR